MWQFIRISILGLFAALLAASSQSEIVAQKKKDGKAKAEAPVASDADYKSIQKQKELPGTIVSFDGRSLTLRVEYPHLEPNPKYKPPKDNPNSNQQYQLWRTYADLQVQMQKAALAKTPREAQQAQQRIAQDMARIQQQYNQMMAKGAAKVDPNNTPFITVTNTKDYDLDIDEKVVYRRLVLPFEYDDTGNIKTYTEKEKAELRGNDRTKPGFLAKADEFTPGTEVKLTLTPPRKVEKSKEEDKEVPIASVARPTVNMIVITKDAPATTTPGKKKDKKK